MNVKLCFKILESNIDMVSQYWNNKKLEED